MTSIAMKSWQFWEITSPFLVLRGETNFHIWMHFFRPKKGLYSWRLASLVKLYYGSNNKPSKDHCGCTLFGTLMSLKSKWRKVGIIPLTKIQYILLQGKLFTCSYAGRIMLTRSHRKRELSTYYWNPSPLFSPWVVQSRNKLGGVI